MTTKKLTKLLALYLPYILLGLVATNFGEAWRLAEGKELGDKIMSIEKQKSTPVMSSSWWTLIRSHLPDSVGGFNLSRSEKCTRKSTLLRLCSVKQ